MANTNTSPNMNLPVPVPTVDPGPDWAQNLYNCLYSLIDQHDHSTGKGVPLPVTSLSGILQAAQFPALTGDVTTSGGSVATTIAAKAVTASKMGSGAAAALTVATADGAGGVSFATPTTAPDASSFYENGSIAATVATNALTLTQNDKNGATPTGSSQVKVGMRNSQATTGTYVFRSVASALSLTISSGTRLGTVSSIAGYVYQYLIDSDGVGTLKVAASTVIYDEGSLQSTVAESYSVTISNASPGVVTANGHGQNNGDAITLTTTGALPTGLSTNTIYYVVSAAANTYQLATTPGGTAINTSSSGSGVHSAHVADGRLACTGVFANVAVRLVGRILISEAAAGTWLTAPTEISNIPFRIPPTLTNWTNNLNWTFNNVTSVSNVSIWTRRVGDTMRVRGQFQAVTTTAATMSLQLPTAYTIDAAKIPAGSPGVCVGLLYEVNGAPTAIFSSSRAYVLFYDGSTTNQIFVALNMTTNAFSKANASGVLSNGEWCAFDFEIPIAQWSA